MNKFSNFAMIGNRLKVHEHNCLATVAGVFFVFVGRYYSWPNIWDTIPKQIQRKTTKKTHWKTTTWKTQLLLISINFTPKTSHSCLTKWYTRFSRHIPKCFFQGISLVLRVWQAPSRVWQSNCWSFPSPSEWMVCPRKKGTIKLQGDVHLPSINFHR